MVLYNEKASEIIEEKYLDENFKTVLTNFWLNDSLRNEMKEKLQKRSKPNATDEIVRNIKKIINWKVLKHIF